MKSCYIKDDIPRLKREIPNNKIILLVYAPWCGHCKTFEPEWDKLVNKVNEIKNVEGYLSRINIDNISELGMDNLNHIQGVPSIVYLQNGKEKQQYNKERNFKELHKWVSHLLNLKNASKTRHNTFKNTMRKRRKRDLGEITQDSVLKKLSHMVGGWMYSSKNKGTKVIRSKRQNSKVQKTKPRKSKTQKSKTQKSRKTTNKNNK